MGQTTSLETTCENSRTTAGDTAPKKVLVAAGSLLEFSEYVFDQLVLTGTNVMAYVPGVDRVTIDRVEHRYIWDVTEMDEASGFVFVGTWYLRDDSLRILHRAQEMSSV